MKKMIMIVAGMGMLSGALAEQTTVTQLVGATVDNVCTYNPNPSNSTYATTDVKNQTFAHGRVDLPVYNALNTITATSNFYIFRCTSNTPWDTTSITRSGDVTMTQKTGTAGTESLNVKYEISPDSVAANQPGVGDVHSADVTFTIPAGQWQATKGTYEGTLSVTIDYN